MLMYNENWKLEYISYEGVNGKVLTNRFKQFAKYEERYGKDLCEMSTDELKSVFSALNIVTPQTRLNTKSLINGYIDWCIHTKKTNKENSLRVLSVNDIASPNAIEMKMLKSPVQVEEILNTIFSSEYCINYPNKATFSKLIFWLFYSGVLDKDIQILKKDSLDYDKKIVISPTDSSVCYEVFDEVIELWKKFVDVDEIEFFADIRDIGRSSKLLDNEYLFRQFDNEKSQGEHVKTHVFRNYLRKMFVNYQEETGTYLLVSISNMILSGYFYKLYISGKSDNEIKNEIMKSNNKNKAFSMISNYKEWRSYFYNV